MAHYAKLDENNIVTEVIILDDCHCIDENGVECEELGRRTCEALTGYAKWKKSDSNTFRGVHYDSKTNKPSEDQSKAFRLNSALAGFLYDEKLDGFIQTSASPRYASFSRTTFNPKTGYFELPKPEVPVPNDPQLELYPLDEYQEDWYWNENEYRWEKLRLDEQRELYHFTNEEMF